MIDAAKANDRVLMVGQVERFNPAVEAVKRAVDGDDIISIQITRVGPFPARMARWAWSSIWRCMTSTSSAI